MEKIVRDALEKILSTSDRIATEALYETIKGELGNLTLAEFRLAMGKLYKEGKLPEYESVRGKYGGNRKRDGRVSRPVEPKETASNVSSDTEVKSEEAEVDDDEGTAGCSVMLSKTLRIHNTDKRNWAIQKLNGDNWLSDYYYSTLPDALKGAAKKIVNNEIRLSISVAKLHELADMILKVEQNILDKLKELPVH